MHDKVTHNRSRWSNGDADLVELREYDPGWPEEFQREAKAIRAELGEELAYSTEHVGSTAIPGLAAKPIIDIILVVPEKRRWPDVVAPLEQLGYSYWADNPDPDRMFFVKGMPPFGSGRTHHVHVHTPETLEPLVRFRDFLVQHPDEARQYSELKRELAKRFERDRDAYTAGKAEFVQEILRKAVRTAGPR